MRIRLHLLNECKNMSFLAFRILVSFPMLFDLHNNSIKLCGVSKAVNTVIVLNVIVVLINSFDARLLGYCWLRILRKCCAKFHNCMRRFDVELRVDFRLIIGMSRH